MTGISDFYWRFLWVITALLVCQATVVAEPLWEWVNPLPQGHSLRAAAAGNGVLVAAGLNGSIIASTDGISWKVGNGTTDHDLREVIWVNGQFVAAGGGFEGLYSRFGVILTSADGFHWVERHRIDEFSIGGLAWGGGRFVVTAGSTLLLSSDGERWTEETLGEEILALGDLVWDGSRFVAVGATSDETQSIFTSEDGLTWQSQPVGCECYSVAITCGNGRYVVVGGTPAGDGTILTSVDAVTWEEQSWEGSGKFYDVVFGHGEFLAVGDRGLVATSPDGHTWSFQDPPTDFDLWGVTEADSGYLAVGEDGFMMTSQDGTSWQVLSEDTLELYRLVEIHEIANKNGVAVGVGSAGLIVRSVDGGPWLIGPAWTIGDYSSVRRIGSYFWAVGDHGVVRSPDGLDWELMLYDTDVRLFDVAWNGSVYVAVGWSLAPVEGEVAIVTSPDGLEWSYQRLDTGGAVLKAVRWTGSRFVAVGAYGIHLTSPDGFSWTQHPLDEHFSLRDMEWNGDRLVAVGKHSNTGRLILSSADGVIWQECLLPDIHGSDFFDVTWTGARFLAVSRPLGDVIFSSRDGIDWSTETTGTGLRLVSIGGDERMLHATGMGGRMIRRVQHLPAPRKPGRRVSPALGRKDTVSSSVVRIHRFH